MNVLITPRTAPRRTDLYSGAWRVQSDGEWLWIYFGRTDSAVCMLALRLRDVAELALDEEAGL